MKLGVGSRGRVAFEGVTIEESPLLGREVRRGWYRGAGTGTGVTRGGIGAAGGTGVAAGGC